MWATYFACCIRCGTNEIKHRAKGFCINCYNILTEEKHKQHDRERGLAKDLLAKDHLIEKYTHQKMSLADIAKECKCSRQYVFKQIKSFNIPLRSKKEARDLALLKNKLFFNRINLNKENSDQNKVTLRKINVNEKFFSSWTPQMAYVLGVICSDGSLTPGFKRDTKYKSNVSVGRLSISQKEPELLNKVLKLMKSDAKLYYSKQSQLKIDGTRGGIYSFHLNNNKIYDDLLKLNISPNKSLVLNFPPVPSDYIRHFIRGCWDGDGSVGVYDNRISASYVSGSYPFIKIMAEKLEEQGFNKVKIFNERKNVFTFRLQGLECEKLYNFFYGNVNPDQYLKRKFIIFQDHFRKKNPNSILNFWDRGKSVIWISNKLKVGPQIVYDVIQKRLDKQKLEGKESVKKVLTDSSGKPQRFDSLII